MRGFPGRFGEQMIDRVRPPIPDARALQARWPAGSYILTTPGLAHRGASSRDDPEGGARCGVLRRRLVTFRPGRPGTPPARHYDLAARSSLHGFESKCPPL